MKAIVTSMEPKAAESGFHACAPKPATGAVFGPFFAMKDLLTPEVADVAGPVGAQGPAGVPEVAEAAGLPSRSWLSRIETGRRAPLAEDALGAAPPDGIAAEPDAAEALVLAVVSEGAPTGQETGEGAHQPMTVPEGADPMPESALVFSPVPEALRAQDADALGADPGQWGAIVHGALPAHAATAGAEATKPSAPAAAPPVSSEAVLRADSNLSQPCHAEAASAAAVPPAEAGTSGSGRMAEDSRDQRGHLAPRAMPHGAASPVLQTQWLEGASAAVVPGTLPLTGETSAVVPTSEGQAVLPLDQPEGVPSRAETALKVADRALAPGETPQRAAIAEPVTQAETTPDGQQKTPGALAEGQSTPPSAASERQPKAPVIVPEPAEPESLAVALLPKTQPVARIATPGKGDRLSPPGPSGPTGPRAASLDLIEAPVTAQWARIAASDARLAEQTANALAVETAMRAQPPVGEHAHAALERPEPSGPATAAARSSALTTPPLPLAFAGLTLNLRQAEWGKQLVGQIERMIKDGSQRMELSLRPKNLGEIRVMLDLRGDRTHVHFLTETAAAARLLSGAEDRLAQTLDQSGYRLSGFSAQEKGAGAQGGQQGQQGQPSARRHRPAGDVTGQANPSEAAAVGTYRADRNQSTGINMLA